MYPPDGFRQKPYLHPCRNLGILGAMKLVLAPMATLSHEALRRAVARFGGCDEYYSEMIQAGTLLTGGPFEQYYITTGPEPEKIVWQITGPKPDALAGAAEMLGNIGGTGIDINMGCCAPDIVRSGAGIAWMLKPPAETAAMLKVVGDTVRNTAKTTGHPLRFSVKIRLGDEDFTDKGFFAFIDMLINAGVEQITLHPRTRKEKHRFLPRYEYVARLTEYLSRTAPECTVILNGAVCDAASARKAVQASPAAAGIMIARAAVQKPWIFAELAGTLPDAIDLLETGLAFINDITVYQPPEFHKTRLQRFFTYYSDNVQFAHYLKTRLLNNPTPDGCRKILTEYFEQCPAEQYLKPGSPFFPAE